MKLILIPLALALSSCMGAGAIQSPGSTPVHTVTDRVVVEAGRGLILANLAYQTVGTAAAVGIEKGLITGTTKTRVQAVSQKIANALADGEKAVKTGDKAASAAAALASIDELCKLHPTLQRACAAVR